jgi:type IV secretion system protein VirB2
MALQVGACIRTALTLAVAPKTCSSALNNDATIGKHAVPKMSMRLMNRTLLAAALTIGASAAHAQAFADPAGSGAIVGAVHWIQGTLLGTVATVAAVVAVAAVGFLMLTGRMNWRYGATVILGCFILFGASSIVAGIQATASSGY